MSDSAAKKSTSDVAAARLGDLLLKGYRMLDAACPRCNTVLMQDKQGVTVCVLCSHEPEVADPFPNEVKRNEQVNGAMNGVHCVNTTLRGNPGIQRAMDIIVKEIVTTAMELEQHRNTSLTAVRVHLLNHIHQCTNVLKDLKSLQH